MSRESFRTPLVISVAVASLFVVASSVGQANLLISPGEHSSWQQAVPHKDVPLQLQAWKLKDWPVKGKIGDPVGQTFTDHRTPSKTYTDHRQKPNFTDHRQKKPPRTSNDPPKR